MADTQPEQSNTSTMKADRASVRQFFRNVGLFLIDAWIDILVLLTMGVAAIIVWIAPHAFDRLFPITFFSTSGDTVYPQFAYPYTPPPLNSTSVGLLCALVPIAGILLFQLQLRSFVDAANALLGLGYALVTGTLFQVTLKKTIGGLRPHFLDVCKPVLPMNPWQEGRGFQSLMFTVGEVCTGDAKRIRNAIESFPSGHSQIAFAGLGFLAVYLFAHTRVLESGAESQGRGRTWGWVGLGVWRMPLVMAPLLAASYISSSLVLSYNHHWYDVLAGGIIGFGNAVFAYRMVFEGWLDQEANFVPRWRVRAEHEVREDVGRKPGGDGDGVEAGVREDGNEGALPR